LSYRLHQRTTFKTALEAFMADWNMLLAHPFQWSYDGKALHEKAVQRFTKMLYSSPAATKTPARSLIWMHPTIVRGSIPEVRQAGWKRFFIVPTAPCGRERGNMKWASWHVSDMPMNPTQALEFRAAGRRYKRAAPNFIKARWQPIHRTKTGYTDAILSLSDPNRGIAKREETIYGLRSGRDKAVGA
jgi:hypothetical protein